MKLKLKLELEAAVRVGDGVGVKCGNENGVGPECGDRLNSPAYKHKHVGYCLHVKAATAAASAACATSVAFSPLHSLNLPTFQSTAQAWKGM